MHFMRGAFPETVVVLIKAIFLFLALWVVLAVLYLVVPAKALAAVLDIWLFSLSFVPGFLSALFIARRVAARRLLLSTVPTIVYVLMLSAVRFSAVAHVEDVIFFIYLPLLGAFIGAYLGLRVGRLASC